MDGSKNYFKTATVDSSSFDASNFSGSNIIGDCKYKENISVHA